MAPTTFNICFDIYPGEEGRRSGVVSWLEEVLNVGEEKSP